MAKDPSAWLDEIISGKKSASPEWPPEALHPVLRRGIIMTTRSINRFEELCPELASKMGVGFRGLGTEWTTWFPPKKEWEEEIIRKLTELRIPFTTTMTWGPRYLEEGHKV